MKNFTSIFRRCVCAVTAGILALFLAGCSKGGGTIGDNSNSDVTVEGIKNLDLTNVVISEHTPSSKEWHTLRLNRIPMSPDIADYMKNTADVLGVSDFNEQNIMYDVRNSDKDLNGIFSIDEMTDDYFADLFSARFVTDDFYFELTQNSMVIFNNRKLIRDTVDDPKMINDEPFYGWYPNSSDTEVIKSYDVSDKEGLKDKYTLNGKEVSILDAMEYAKKFMNEEQPRQNNSDIFSYEPIEIEVYKQTDTSYGYYFRFQTYLDGVPIDAAHVGNIPGSPSSLFSMFNYVYMLGPSSVAYYWASPLYNNELSSKEPCEIKVDFNEAAAIVSEKLSHEHVFTVERAELMYCVDGNDPTKINDDRPLRRHTVIKPMWQFTITNTGMHDYETLFAYVDAVSGEMSVLGGS